MASLERCVFIDMETRSRYSIENGAFAYAAHPSTDILCVAYAIEDGETVVCTPDMNELYPLFQAIKDGYTIIAHNMLFEIAMIKYVFSKKYQCPVPNLNQWRCTMQMAGRAGLPLSLEYCAKSLDIKEKLGIGRVLIHIFCIPNKDTDKFVSLNSRPKEAAKFFEYCKTDVDVSREIWQNLPEWKPSEIDDVLFDLLSNLRGVPVDTETSARIYTEVVNQQAGFAKRVNELTNGVITKMTQAQRIKKWMIENVSEEIDNCQAETVERILGEEFGEVDRVSREILEMRVHSGKSSTSKYLRFIYSNVDGRVYGMIISFGAHTGRAVSKLLNLYNLPKPSIKYDSMDSLVKNLQEMNPSEIEDEYGSYLKSASTAIRGMITPDREEDTLVVADYAAIEARIVFWLADCKKGLRKYRENVDLYKDMAAFIYHISYYKIGDEERWLGKQVILGAGFGLGAQGFVNSCARWGVDVPLDLAQEAITTYRETYPEVVELWNDLDNASITACKTGKVVHAAKGKIAFKTFRTKSGVVMLQMKLPSGRCLTYPSVQLNMVTTPWGAKRLAVTYHKVSDKGFRRESTYGGKLTENAVQAIARDIYYYGAKNAANNGYDVLFGVYDEVVAIAPKETADIDEFCNLICETPNWATNLPIKAEGKLMTRYQKL